MVEVRTTPRAVAVNINFTSIAQSVEHAAVNRGVVGSSPTGAAMGRIPCKNVRE